MGQLFKRSFALFFLILSVIAISCNVDQRNVTLPEVADVFSESAKALTSEKQRAIREDYIVFRACYLRGSKQPKVLKSIERMEQLIAILDSSKLLFQSMLANESNKSITQKNYLDYKLYINENRNTLHVEGDTVGLIFNSYLHLDENLLPENVKSKQKNSTELSVIVLEEALTYHILFLFERLSHHFGGCEH